MTVAQASSYQRLGALLLGVMQTVVGLYSLLELDQARGFYRLLGRNL